MSADESASLHESLARWLLDLPAFAGLRDSLTGGDDLKASFAWVWLLLPLIVAVSAFLVVLVVRSLRTQPRALWLFLSGLAALLGAVGLEAAVSTFPRVADWSAPEVARYGLLTTIEESAELIGISLLFAALALHVAPSSRPRNKPGQI